MDATRSRQYLRPPFASFGAWTGRFRPTRLGLAIAPATGAMVALGVALLVLQMPVSVLESLSTDSGLPALVAAAAPPLGLTARLSAALLAAATVGGIVWFALFLMLDTRSLETRGEREDGVPILRRADAHPDAPARRPVFANSDLGTPFLEVKAAPGQVLVADPDDLAAPTDHEWSLPADLDTPLATYLHPSDTIGSAGVPLPILGASDPVVPPLVAATSTVEPEASAEGIQRPQATAQPPLTAGEKCLATSPLPIGQRFAADERIETIELTPSVRATASIHDLLDRLERGVARKQPVSVPHPIADEGSEEKSLEDTLDALRALARRVG